MIRTLCKPILALVITSAAQASPLEAEFSDMTCGDMFIDVKQKMEQNLDNGASDTDKDIASTINLLAESLEGSHFQRFLNQSFERLEPTNADRLRPYFVEEFTERCLSPLAQEMAEHAGNPLTVKTASIGVEKALALDYSKDNWGAPDIRDVDLDTLNCGDIVRDVQEMPLEKKISMVFSPLTLVTDSYWLRNEPETVEDEIVTNEALKLAIFECSIMGDGLFKDAFETALVEVKASLEGSAQQ